MLRKSSITIVAAVVFLLLTGAGWSQVGVKETVVMQTTKTLVGQNLAYPVARPQITTMLVEIAPGRNTFPHMHRGLAVTYVLAGTLMVQGDGIDARRYKAGEAFVEPINTWHIVGNGGVTPLRILIVYVGAEGQPVRVYPSSGPCDPAACIGPSPRR
jgi:quercetin dioxygenase-like cupin family protein